MDCRFRDNLTTAEKSACSCQDSLNIFKSQALVYNKKYTQYEKDLANYNEYKKLEKDLENCRGPYEDKCKKIKEDLQKHRKSWISCSPDFVAWGTHQDYDHYCVNDLNKDYKHKRFTHDGSGCSGGRYKGVCEYTKGAIERLTQEKLRRDHMPETINKNIGVWSGKSKPTPPTLPTSNITCCSLNISDLEAGGTIDINNISQNCSSEINSAKESGKILESKPVNFNQSSFSSGGSGPSGPSASRLSITGVGVGALGSISSISSSLMLGIIAFIAVS